ncbi:nickel transporter permease [Chelativorans sp. AA-79]|uniref:nickel transporter permease n=1 Tax=Chelativorans sp. AA-79 TaxID=3028735 RepID=UPI0023F9DAE2|nr:nickel transporter permease [Chelativorans sp. AA-79]WEX11098.1 ABC transporter permease [Chelativorans sp. AA-79]
MSDISNRTFSAWIAAEEPASSRQATAQRFYWSAVNFFANPLTVIGLLILLVLALMAALAPLIATHDPIAQNLTQALKPPSAEHWLGTDELGRDIYSRIVFGARITLYIVTLVSVIVGPIGLLIGMAAGYFGGWTDRILMRITDLFLSFPSLILALAFAAALGPGLENAVIAIALTAWPPIARLARAETLTVRNTDYIAAAKLTGASPLRILVGQILPMCVPSVVVRLTLNMAGIILTAAGLGFLGLGAQPPSPEWGAMTSAGRRFMMESWWVVTMPGSAILIVSLAFNLFGDGLRDLLDPRQRQ